MNPPVHAPDDVEALNEALVTLERSIKILRRVYSNPLTRERAQSIRHAATAVYVAIREVEWREGIPSAATVAWASGRLAKRKE